MSEAPLITSHLVAMKPSLTLSADEQSELFEVIATGSEAEANAAAHQIACANYNLIPYTLQRMTMPYSTTFTYEDATSEGYIALHHAAMLFKPSMKFTFATYAVTSIMRQIQRQYDVQFRAIRVPVYRLAEARNAMRDEANGPLDPDIEIEVERSLLKPVASLGLANNLPETSDDDPWRDVNSRQFIEDFHALFIAMSNDPREWDVLIARAGLDGDVVTLDALGERYDVTRERIRQIESRARGLALELLRLHYPYLVQSRVTRPPKTRRATRPNARKSQRSVPVKAAAPDSTDVVEITVKSVEDSWVRARREVASIFARPHAATLTTVW